MEILQPVTVYLIFVTPTLNAVTSPVEELTVATAMLLLVQIPPASPLLLNVCVAPIQSGEVPEIIPGLLPG